MTEKIMRFKFGQNWENYIKKNFSDERVEISKCHLLDFLKMDNLQNKSFLDIGCGSGLHSLAAFRAGASKIVSFDFDPISVQTTLKLREYAGNPSEWKVSQGSILDDGFLRSLEPADIVYSWGVLHHTGDMWKAMDNSIQLIRPDGCFYVALYDYDIQVKPTPEFWLTVKQKYNQSEWLGKRKMELWYLWRFMLYGNPLLIPYVVFRAFRYKHLRGMALYTDIVDWLGGWPMDFAKREDVKNWAGRNSLGIVSMKTGEANTEYLFKKIE